MRKAAELDTWWTEAKHATARFKESSPSGRSRIFPTHVQPIGRSGFANLGQQHSWVRADRQCCSRHCVTTCPLWSHADRLGDGRVTNNNIRERRVEDRHIWRVVVGSTHAAIWSHADHLGARVEQRSSRLETEDRIRVRSRQSLSPSSADCPDGASEGASVCNRLSCPGVVVGDRSSRLPKFLRHGPPKALAA